MPDLRNQLDTPENRTNRTEHIGCQGDIFSLRHGESDGSFCAGGGGLVGVFTDSSREEITVEGRPSKYFNQGLKRQLSISMNDLPRGQRPHRITVIRSCSQTRHTAGEDAELQDRGGQTDSIGISPGNLFRQDFLKEDQRERKRKREERRRLTARFSHADDKR